jgi:hypothetical protein
VKCGTEQLKSNDIFDFDYLAYYQHSSAIVKLFEIYLFRVNKNPNLLTLLKKKGW